jgi:hypothetical protein
MLHHIKTLKREAPLPLFPTPEQLTSSSALWVVTPSVCCLRTDRHMLHLKSVYTEETYRRFQLSMLSLRCMVLRDTSVTIDTMWCRVIRARRVGSSFQNNSSLFLNAKPITQMLQPSTAFLA